MPVDNHNDGTTAQATIDALERENTTLRIQLLTVTRDLANIVAMLANGHLEQNGLGEP